MYIDVCIHDHTIAGTRLQYAVWAEHIKYTYKHIQTYSFIRVWIYT